MEIKVKTRLNNLSERGEIDETLSGRSVTHKVSYDGGVWVSLSGGYDEVTSALDILFDYDVVR